MFRKSNFKPRKIGRFKGVNENTIVTNEKKISIFYLLRAESLRDCSFGDVPLILGDNPQPPFDLYFTRPTRTTGHSPLVLVLVGGKLC